MYALCISVAVSGLAMALGGTTVMRGEEPTREIVRLLVAGLATLPSFVLLAWGLLECLHVVSTLGTRWWLAHAMGAVTDVALPAAMLVNALLLFASRAAAGRREALVAARRRTAVPVIALGVLELVLSVLFSGT